MSSKIELETAEMEETEVETEQKKAFLDKPKKVSLIVKKKEERKNSGIRDFLKSMSSTATLPGYIKGNEFSSKKGVTNQIILAVSVIILSVGAGAPIGFSAVLLPQLYNENSTMKIDVEMGSWIASIHSAATPIGAFASGPLMELVGRRRALQLTVIPMVIGWIIIATSSSHLMLLLGRVVAGLAIGSTGAPSQVYLGEISEPKLRGLLIGVPFVAYALGILVIYALGAVLPWRTAAALSTVLPIIAFLALSLSPESPTWLAKKRRFQDAIKSIARLRGDESIAQRELHQLMSAIEKDKRDQENVSFWATMKQASVIKPLLIINIFGILQTFSGTYMIVFYAVDIINGAAGGQLNGVLAANITAVLRFVCTIVASVMLYHIGRRTIGLVSGIGSTVAMLTLGIYLWVTIGKEKTQLDFWVTAVCLFVYISFNTIGFFILPGMMIGEMLPVRARGMCGGYIFMIFNTTVFGMTKMFPLISSTMGSHGMFVFFGLSALLATIFVYLFVPEAKGKTLLELEEYFRQPNLMWITRKRDDIAS